MLVRYLVTGAAGFIGYHLSRELLNRGATVVGLDNVNSYYDPSLKEARLGLLESGPAFHFVRGDLADQAAISQAFESGPFDCVVHLAAQAGVRHSIDNPAAYIQSNVLGFFNILEACRHNKPRHLLYASSSSVYGLNKRTPFKTADHTDHPVSLYAATKKANEVMAHSYSHLYHIPATGLRFFTVYGPWGRPDMAYFKFAGAILRGEPIKMFNHGELWRDFTYIDDVVESIIRLIPEAPKPDAGWDAFNPSPASSRSPHRVLNIGNAQPVKLTEFISVLERSLGKTAILDSCPMQAGDVETTYADVTEVSRLTGFSPSTPLATGLRNFADWYRSRYETP